MVVKLREGLEQLLSPEDLSAYLAVPIRTVYDWRYQGRGPKGIKVGKHIRYRASDVAAWLEANAGATAG